LAASDELQTALKKDASENKFSPTEHKEAVQAREGTAGSFDGAAPETSLFATGAMSYTMTVPHVPDAPVAVA
jgi:hypothetical protein